MFRAIAACAAAVLVVAAAGCATPSEPSAEAREQPVYRTGSNLPVRDASVPGGVRVEKMDETNAARVPMPRPGQSR
jgi:hypothetical protein